MGNEIARSNVWAALGAVISAAAVLVSVTIVVQTVRAVSEQNARDVADLRTAVSAIELRTRSLEQANVADEERHAMVIIALRRIDERLQRAETGAESPSEGSK